MKYYHVTSYYHGPEHIFVPTVPHYLQKGEDKGTPRICVCDNWRRSYMSIVLLNLSHGTLYVYSAEAEPVDPNAEREKLLQAKTIRKNQNKFRMPPDGQVNREKWYLEPTPMKLEGMVTMPLAMRAQALMGMGMFNDPDVSKLNLEPYKPYRDMFSREGR